MTEHHDRSAGSEELAEKLEKRAQFHVRNCSGGLSYFSDIDAQLMKDAAASIRSIRDDAQPTQEPVAWQWRAPLSGKWYTDDTPDDPKVQKGLKDEGYQFRPLYASKPSPAATVNPVPSSFDLALLNEREVLRAEVEHFRSSAATDDLIERLRNPMWAHSTAPFLSPQLEQEENLAAMNEAAAEIERLRAVPQAATDSALTKLLEDIERIASSPISGTSLQQKAQRFDLIRDKARAALALTRPYEAPPRAWAEAKADIDDGWPNKSNGS